MTYEEFKIIQSTIPNEPGVYRYFSIEDEIIYIGKAKDLRKRVSSYFTKNDHTYRIQRMIKTIHRLEFTIVDTEQEAFLLENALIKNHQPRYNILLRDDKTYPFICIKKEPFPRVFLTRQVIKDGSEYLGPYTSILTVKAILSMLINIFPLRNCTLQLNKKNIEAGKFKVCLEYHIKNCLGPCQALQSEQEYMENIQQVRELLKSNFGIVQNFLKKRMNEFAEQMDFERANEFKEKIEILEAYRSKSIIVNPKLNNIDVYGYTETHEFAFINFLKIANGTVVRTRSYEVKKILNEEKEDILQRVVIDNSFADNIFVEELLFPFSISLPFDNIQITVPLAGDKKKLLDLSTKNAMYAREEKIKAGLSAEERNPSFRIMKTLKDDLKLQELPVHIECFDNSNFQGTNAVSACVVFKQAKPSKKDYRIFNVKTVEGPDDFATMQEVVYRRYKRLQDENQELPQLIIVDGGKGQLSSAVESLKQLDLYGKIPIVGIAKRLEEIYFPEDSVPLYINKKSESLKLIQRMRDEAHRFGITHHRAKRSKNTLVSELTDINGIGEKTFELLLKKYRSVKKIKEVAEADLAEIIGPAKAALLVQHFQASLPNE
jgi:excinuclease ABC subunit C